MIIGASKDTKKATAYVVKLYNSVMEAACKETGKEFIELNNCPVEELPGRLSQFFMLVKRKNGKHFNASSIEGFYQSIARYLLSDHKEKPDIKRDAAFKVVRDTKNTKCTEVAKEGARPGIKASKAVPSDLLQLAHERQTLGRSNPRPS